MAGGTSVHRKIQSASLGRDEKRFLFKKQDREPFATRTLYVSLDNADNVIDGCRTLHGFVKGAGLAVAEMETGSAGKIKLIVR